jgi:hypothetical protein
MVKRHSFSRRAHAGRMSFVNSPVESEAGEEADRFAHGGRLRRKRRTADDGVIVVGTRSKPRADRLPRTGDDGDGYAAGGVTHHLHRHLHLHHDADSHNPEELAALHEEAADGRASIHHHLHSHELPADDSGEYSDGKYEE